MNGHGNLILTRRPGEAVKIGDDVTVTITGVKGNQVRISIDAPLNVQVDRSEVRKKRDAGVPPPKRSP